jgi:hypothetical protein
MARKPIYTRAMLEAACQKLSPSESTAQMMALFGEAVSKSYEEARAKDEETIAQLRSDLKKAADFIQMVQGAWNDSKSVTEMRDKLHDLVCVSGQYFPVSALDEPEEE